MARQVWAKKDPQSAVTCILDADQRVIILRLGVICYSVLLEFLDRR